MNTYPVIFENDFYKLEVSGYLISDVDYDSLISIFKESKFYLTGDAILPFDKLGYKFKLTDKSGGTKILGVYLDNSFMKEVKTISGEIEFDLFISLGKHLLEIFYQDRVVIRLNLAITNYALFLWVIASIWKEYRDGIDEVSKSRILKLAPDLIRLEQNFGYLVGIEPDDLWTVELYREILQEIFYYTCFAGKELSLEGAIGAITSVLPQSIDLRFSDLERWILHYNFLRDDWKVI